MNHLSESEIREILRVFARRLSTAETDALLVEEVAVDGGRNRIDMLYFGDSTIGVEIKSARDDLSRLPAQAASFGQYFDYLILVADDKQIDRATKILPSCWGIFEISNNDGRIRLTKIREPRRNRNAKSELLLELLWKSELLSIFDRVQDAESGERLAKRDLRKELIHYAEDDQIRQWSISAILNREDWRGIRLPKAS
jgi:hypothetical protein